MSKTPKEVFEEIIPPSLLGYAYSEMKKFQVERFGKETDRLHVRYYKADGTYLDHGRLVGIGGKIPEKGWKIAPFTGIDGPIIWKVMETKLKPDDTCVEIYVEI